MYVARCFVVILRERLYPTVISTMLPPQLREVVQAKRVVYPTVRVEHDAAELAACGGTSNASNTPNHAKHDMPSTCCVTAKAMQIPSCAENDTAASAVCSDPDSDCK